MIDGLFLRVLKRLRGAETGCMEWSGALDRDGYGKLTVGKKTWRAHRLVWGLCGGRLDPEAGYLLHKCHNRKCCNPLHLYLGTAAQNGADRVAARAAGIRHPGPGAFIPAGRKCGRCGRRRCVDCPVLARRRADKRLREAVSEISPAQAPSPPQVGLTE